MTSVLVAVLVILLTVYAAVRVSESRVFVDLVDGAKSMSPVQQMVAVLVVCGFAVYGGSKGVIVVPVKQLSFMFFDPALRAIFPSGLVGEAKQAEQVMTDIFNADNVLTSAAANITQAVDTASEVLGLASNYNALTIAVDWPHSARPEPANIMASEILVCPTNIANVLYEIRYIEFSQLPSEAPNIVVEFRDQRGNAALAESDTNSFPDLFNINVQSGSHSCYWFRVKVPDQFKRNLRTWETDVKFGGPIGSAYGFEISGLIVISEGGNYWRGLTKDLMIGGELRTFDDGVLMPPLVAAMDAPQPEERLVPLLRQEIGQVEVLKQHNKLIITDGFHRESIKLAFPVK